MKKKPSKVNEPQASYAAKKPGKTAPQPAPQADDAAFQRVADKIFTERKELLRKLAQ